MNANQKKAVEDYREKYGYDDVKVVETSILVQLQLAHSMIAARGLSLSWLETFSKHFFNISIGIRDEKTEDCAMFITMFKKP